MMSEEKLKELQVFCKAILGRVKPLCDEFTEVVEMFTDIVSGAMEISMHIIEAGTGVQLPDHSKNVGRSCGSMANTLLFIMGTQAQSN